MDIDRLRVVAERLLQKPESMKAIQTWIANPYEAGPLWDLWTDLWLAAREPPVRYYYNEFDYKKNAQARQMLAEMCFDMAEKLRKQPVQKK